MINEFKEFSKLLIVSELWKLPRSLMQKNVLTA